MALDRDIEPLLRHELLAVLPREALRLLAFAAESRLVRAGDVLFRKGEAAEEAYLVISGQIALDEKDDGSPAQVIVGPGALIGEMALFTAIQRPATAVARETGSLLKLPRSLMARVLGEFPAAALAVRNEIARRVALMSGEIGDVRRRLIAD